MAEYIEVVFKCPCGAHLGTRIALKGSKTKSNWTTKCNSCKSKIRCTLAGNEAFVSKIS